MESSEIEKSKVYSITEIIDYVPNAVASKTLLKKLTGNIIISSLDAGEGFSEKISPFETFVQIIDGNAEIIIDGESTHLGKGDGIIIPAHQSNSIKANQRVKMIWTTIKSGYE